MNAPIKDTRLQCPHCKVRTWRKDFAAFMADHDRPDGRVCRKATFASAATTVNRIAREPSSPRDRTREHDPIYDGQVGPSDWYGDDE